ncbi:MAG: ATP-binding protein [Thermaerobacter sp.]|nr:ATP-binding protein [Thermaerobacter sp.]
MSNVRGDSVIATAILDALLHQSQVLNIRGRDRVRNGLTRPINTAPFRAGRGGSIKPY